MSDGVAWAKRSTTALRMAARLEKTGQSIVLDVWKKYTTYSREPYATSTSQLSESIDTGHSLNVGKSKRKNTWAFPMTLGNMSVARALNEGVGEAEDGGEISISTGYLIFKRRR